MSSYNLPYDLSAIERFRADMRHLANQIERAGVVAARQGASHIGFEGPAADRYTKHLGKQTRQLSGAARRLAAMSGHLAGLVDEATRLNRAYVVAMEAVAESARRAMDSLS